MKLKIEISDAVFNTAGTFFIKLELYNLFSFNADSGTKLRTEVFAEETTRPSFNQNKFLIEYNENMLTASSKLVLTACQIKTVDSGNVAVVSVGNSEIMLEKILGPLDENGFKTTTSFIASPRSSEHSLTESKGGASAPSTGKVTVTFSRPPKTSEDDLTASQVQTKRNAANTAQSDTSGSSAYNRIVLARSLIDISRSTSEYAESDKVSAAAEPIYGSIPIPPSRLSTMTMARDLTPEPPQPKLRQKNGEFKEESESVPFLEAPLYLGMDKERYDEFSIELPKAQHRDPYFIVNLPGGSHPGQTIIVQIHDVWDLPCMRNATTGTALLPTPFLTAKSEKDTKLKKRAKAATHVHSPSREASYGEVLYMDFKEPYAQTNIPKIFISIADNLTKRFIAKFCIPISNTFFPSHRQLSMILRSVSPTASMSSPHARVSITSVDTLVSSPYILQREYDEKMVFLELILKELKTLPFEARTIAVLKLVQDGSAYTSKIKTMQSRYNDGFHFGDPLKPHLILDFDAAGKLLDEDAFSKNIFWDGLQYNRDRRPRLKQVFNDEYYQMTTASGELDKVPKDGNAADKQKVGFQPQWNQHFLFAEEMAKFTPETSLVIEFYREPVVVSASDPIKLDNMAVDFDQPSEGRPINDLFGYSVIPLGDFTVLPVTDPGKTISLEKIKVNFVGKYERLPGTGAVFCCLDFRIPDNWHLLRPKTPKNGYGQQQNENRDRVIVPDVETIARKISQIESLEEQKFPKRIKDRKRDDPLPDMTFEELIKAVKKEREDEELEREKRQQEEAKSLDPTRMIFTFHDIEQRQKLIDRLMQELESRTNAVKKVGADLYASREKNAQKDEKIKKLEQKIAENDVKTIQLLNTVDVDVIPVDELKRRYALLAKKFQMELNKTRDLSDQLQSAQASKIERNQVEKKYLELRQAHTAQAAYIQKLQESLQKTAKYKRAIQKQEQVIQKLEILLKDAMNGSSSKVNLEEFFSNAKMDPDTFDGGVYRLLTEENLQLKDKLLELERKMTPGTKRSADITLEYEIQKLREEVKKEREKVVELEEQRRDMGSGDLNTDMFKLLMRAEKAEARVKSLEQELMNSAKTYARGVVDRKVFDDSLLSGKVKSSPSTRSQSPASLKSTVSSAARRHQRLTPIP